MAQSTYHSANPAGYQQVTSITSTAKGLTVPANTGANYAVIRVAGANLRWRDDGTAPTATVGVPLNIGEVLNYDGNLAAVQFIAQAGTGSLDVSYYAE